VESSVETKDPDLTRFKRQFDEYLDNTQESRQLAEKCRDYKDGKQWTAAEEAVLKKRKQPVITDNKIQDKVNTLMGLERQQRTDPKAYPRNPADADSADAATDALRYIADKCDYQRSSRRPAMDNLIVEGLCFGLSTVEKEGDYPCISMEHIRWDRGYYDIRSQRDDFSDGTYCGYFTWMDLDDAKLEFKDKETELEQTFNGEAQSERTVEDKPRYCVSVNGRKRVQVFTHFHKVKGVWQESKWCKGGILEAPKPCTFKDENGKPQCPMEIQALYRDADGNPYSAVERFLDLQDEHNKRRSKMLHLLNSKRLITQKGSFEDINAARTELHKPDGVLEVNANIDQVRVEDNLNAADGQWRLMEQTANALAMTGPNAALQGQTGSISGRAKQLDQQSGALMLSPIFDALDAWETRMYRQAWNRVRQFWKAPMWIRVTDDEQKLKFVGLNQPVTYGEQQAEALKGQQMPDEQKAAMVAQIAQHPDVHKPAVGPGNTFLKRNDVARMDVDIIISRSEDTVNIQQEQFEILAGIAEKRPEVPFTAILKLSGLRADVKRQVEDEMKGGAEGQQQVMALQQQAEALQQQQEAMQEQAKTLADAKMQIDQDAEAVKADHEQVKAALGQLNEKEASLEVKEAQFEAAVAKAMASLTVQDTKLQLHEVQSAANDQQAQIEDDKGNLTQAAQDAVRQIADLVTQFTQHATQAHEQLQQFAATQAAPRPLVKALRRTKDGFVPEYH
jgi:hypothetical protein